MRRSSHEKHKILGQRLNQSQGFNPKTKTGISTSVMQCRSSGLIFSNPQPVPFDIQDHYSVPPENYFRPDQYNKKLSDFKQGMKALDKLWSSP